MRADHRKCGGDSLRLYKFVEGSRGWCTSAGHPPDRVRNGSGYLRGGAARCASIKFRVKPEAQSGGGGTATRKRLIQHFGLFFFSSSVFFRALAHEDWAARFNLHAKGRIRRKKSAPKKKNRDGAAKMGGRRRCGGERLQGSEETAALRQMERSAAEEESAPSRCV